MNKKNKQKLAKKVGKEEKKYSVSKAKKRYNDRVWKGWRESDGKTYPVTGSGGKKKIEK